MFQGNFKGVPRKFLERLKEVSKNIEGCFHGVLSRFQGFQEFQWVFQVSSKAVSRLFRGTFKGVSRKIEDCC